MILSIYLQTKSSHIDTETSLSLFSHSLYSPSFTVSWRGMVVPLKGDPALSSRDSEGPLRRPIALHYSPAHRADGGTLATGFTGGPIHTPGIHHKA